jgi:hypothetical protein
VQRFQLVGFSYVGLKPDELVNRSKNVGVKSDLRETLRHKWLGIEPVEIKVKTGKLKNKKLTEGLAIFTEGLWWFYGRTNTRSLPLFRALTITSVA